MDVFQHLESRQLSFSGRGPLSELDAQSFCVYAMLEPCGATPFWLRRWKLDHWFALGTRASNNKWVG